MGAGASSKPAANRQQSGAGCWNCRWVQHTWQHRPWQGACCDLVVKRPRCVRRAIKPSCLGLLIPQNASRCLSHRSSTGVPAGGYLITCQRQLLSNHILGYTRASWQHLAGSSKCACSSPESSMASELYMQHTVRGFPGQPLWHCCTEWRAEDGVHRGQPCCLLPGHPAAGLCTTDDHGGYCVCCRQLHWRDCMQ